MPTSQLAHVEKRRSMRINQTVLLMISGVDALRAPYVEKVPTLTLSCHGCRYRSKHEVIPGDIVLLGVAESAERPLVSTQARVKWLKPTTMGTERLWEVNVELETPGNVWGVVSPPEDWFAAESKVIGAKSGQELRVVPRSEQQVASVLHRVAAQFSVLEPAPASLDPFLVGLNEHIQKMIAEAAIFVFVKEKDSIIEKFRAQLQDETNKALDRVIGCCEDKLIHTAARELNAFARSTQEHWVNKIDEGLNHASARMVAQATEVSGAIENLAASAIEQLQLKMDALRGQTMDDFRIGSLNMCKQAVDFVQQSADRFANQMQQRMSELRVQFENNVNERLARAGYELEQKSSAVLDLNKLVLLKLSEDCQETVQGRLQDLAVSTTNELATTLDERAAEISKQHLGEVQGCTRRYLESISGSLTEALKKTASFPVD